MGNRSKWLLVFGLSIFCVSAYSQSTDSIARKNVIKYNLSAPALYSKAFLFQYERVLNPNRSISLQFGHITLPELLARFDNVRKITDSEKFGYNLTVDYRFYLEKENKHHAPRGVYLAPFASIHHFRNVKDFEIQGSESNEFDQVSLNSRMNILSAGVALGYQFVIWDRMTLDFLLLGPSISNYNVDMNLDGDLSELELEENLQQIIDQMADRFPFFNSLLEDKIAEFNGRSNFSSIGFRYSVAIGIRF